MDDRAAPSRSRASSLWRLFAASKTALAVALVTGMIAGGGVAGLLAFLTRAMEGGREQSVEVVVGFFVLCVVALGSSAVSLILLSRVAQDNLYHLRIALGRRILAAPLHKLEVLGAPRLLAALTEDVSSVVAAQQTLPSIFVEGSKVVAVFVYLLSLSPLLFLGVAFYVAVNILSMRPALAWARSFLEGARETENDMFAHFRALVEGGKELKMNARRRRAFIDEKLCATASRFRRQSVMAQAAFVLIDRWSEALFYFFLGLLLFIVPRYWDIAPETLTAFALATLFLGGPLSMVGSWLPTLGKGVVAMRNIESMGLGLDAETHGSVGISPTTGDASGAIELRGVTYRRRAEGNDAGYAIGPIDLRIEPGEIVFLTGGNGSGKTTLALVLLGLFAPDSGEIRLCGRKIGDADRDAYRQNFSAVFADAFIFDSLLGHSERAAQDRVEDLLQRLMLADKVRLDNGRFSTIELSRGQRKRLALVAAFIEDRPFYLFDEWASEQDPAFREMFYLTLLPELKARGRTVVAITHDDRYFAVADRVLHMSGGRLSQERSRRATAESLA